MDTIIKFGKTKSNFFKSFMRLFMFYDINHLKNVKQYFQDVYFNQNKISLWKKILM